MLVAACVLSGCYSPSPPANTPCPDGFCPSGLVCIAEVCVEPGTEPPIDSAQPSIDAAIDTPANLTCYGTGIVTVCPDATPVNSIVVNAVTTIDTDASPQCIAYTGTPDLCVLAGVNIAINSTLRATGSRPFVLLAVDAIQIGANGDVDVASEVGGAPGAGANASECIAGTAASAGEGGAGGSFTGRGGGGGLGEGAGSAPESGAIQPADKLRGGCRGGDGSDGDGGNGGGAVFLIASSLVISGEINASGSGGRRSITNNEGGGGGGSGGMIGLDAATIIGAGLVFANGGGGGAGNETSSNGEESQSPLVPGRGGEDLGGNGGNGGDGSAGMALDGKAGSTGTDGGGGGGGGAGAIRVFPPRSLTLSLSPPAT